MPVKVKYLTLLNRQRLLATLGLLGEATIMGLANHLNLSYDIARDLLGMEQTKVERVGGYPPYRWRLREGVK